MARGAGGDLHPDRDDAHLDGGRSGHDDHGADGCQLCVDGDVLPRPAGCRWGDGPLHDGAAGAATVASTVPPRVHKHEALDVGIVAVSGVVTGVLRAIKHVITPGADTMRLRLLSSSRVAHPRRPSPRCYFPCRIPRSRSLGGSHVEPPNSHPGRPRMGPHRSTGTRFRDHPHRGVIPLRLEVEKSAG